MNADRLETKRSEAEARNTQWAALSFEKQLSHLDSMFGKGKGGSKQRLKIAAKIKIRDAAPTKKAKKK